jgi:hypothetical protein
MIRIWKFRDLNIQNIKNLIILVVPVVGINKSTIFSTAKKNAVVID